MKTRTVTVTVAADRDAVFAYLANLGNLPEWAPDLCRDVWKEEKLWRGITPGGEDYFALIPHEQTGVIDLLIGQRPDEMTVFPVRVLRRPHGTAVICTAFQSSDWADELFERYYGALVSGLRGVMARYGGGELKGEPLSGHSFYPNLVTAKFYETWDFYTAQLGFRTRFESDQYLHLVHPCGAQLGILREELDGTREELITATNGRGFWISLDVLDADAEHERLRQAGVDVAEPIADMPWGERQFMVRDPNGVLIAIAHRFGGARNAAIAELLAG